MNHQQHHLGLSITVSCHSGEQLALVGGWSPPPGARSQVPRRAPGLGGAGGGAGLATAPFRWKLMGCQVFVELCSVQVGEGPLPKLGELRIDQLCR